VSALIDARRVSKRFLLQHGTSAELKVRVMDKLLRRRTWTEEFWALRNISLRIGTGEGLGLVGRNGSGKSTLLKLIAGLHRPTSGELLVRADLRFGTMIELGVGFHGELTGRENVFLNASLYGLSRDAIAEKYPAIVEYAGLSHFMDVPLKAYSSGMQMRLGFAVAATLDPDVLLIDEVFAVGDQDFQVKCIDTLKQFQSRGGTLLFVSHAPSAVRALCDRVCVLDRGELAFDGATDDGLNFYERLVASGLTPRAWHRLRHGLGWAARGEWAADLLRREGLQPEQFVLDLGCGSLGLGRLLLPYLAQSRYWGFEQDRDLLFDGIAIELTRADIDPVKGHFIVNRTFDLSECPHRFSWVMASSLFSRLPLHSVVRCLANVLPALEPGGRCYFTLYEGPVTDDVRREDGLLTKADGEPYHHDPNVLTAVVASLGGVMQRVETSPHPRGESVFAITPD